MCVSTMSCSVFVHSVCNEWALLSGGGSVREFCGCTADFSQGTDCESFRRCLEDAGLIKTDDEESEAALES